MLNCMGDLNKKKELFCAGIFQMISIVYHVNFYCLWNFIVLTAQVETCSFLPAAK